MERHEYAHAHARTRTCTRARTRTRKSTRMASKMTIFCDSRHAFAEMCVIVAANLISEISFEGFRVQAGLKGIKRDSKGSTRFNRVKKGLGLNMVSKSGLRCRVSVARSIPQPDQGFEAP